MKFFSYTLLIAFIITTISCVDEDEYTTNKNEQNFNIEHKINNSISNKNNDSIIIYKDSIRITENTEPCIGWDCQWITK